MIKCCSQDCPDRSPTCHATCEKYLTEKLMHDIESDRRRKDRDAQRAVYDSQRESVNRQARNLKKNNHKKVY